MQSRLDIFFIFQKLFYFILQAVNIVLIPERLTVFLVIVSGNVPEGN